MLFDTIYSFVIVGCFLFDVGLYWSSLILKLFKCVLCGVHFQIQCTFSRCKLQAHCCKHKDFIVDRIPTDWQLSFEIYHFVCISGPLLLRILAQLCYVIHCKVASRTSDILSTCLSNECMLKVLSLKDDWPEYAAYDKILKLQSILIL